MKETRGFITDDGTFFESRQEALLHEAEELLRGNVAAEFPDLNVDQFLGMIITVLPTLKGYINAHTAANTVKRDQQAQDEDRATADGSPSAEVDAGLGHVSSTEEDLASLLKLPARRPSDMPNVGSGSRAEKVPDRGAEHGARVRRGDASNVRRRKDMATEQGAESGQPRTGRR